MYVKENAGKKSLAGGLKSEENKEIGSWWK